MNSHRYFCYLWNYKFTLAYISCIPLVALLFMHIPFVSFPDGSQISPVSLIVGLVFVCRDFAQREIGRKIIYAMLTATVLTFLLADPALALAGTAAFFISEIVDWMVFTFTTFSLSTRVMLSSLIAVPLDSAIVLYGLSFSIPYALNLGNFLVLSVAKLVVACLIAACLSDKRDIK